MFAKKNLNDLCIIVTRPSPQGEILCDEILACGGRAIYFPTIEIGPPNDIFALQKNLSELNDYDWIIFISPQSVYQSVKKMPSLVKNVKIAAIGAGTALALQEAGLTVDVYPLEEWSSEGLLALSEFQSVTHKKIALIQGEGGRKLLADELAARGAEVVSIVAYQRNLPNVNIDAYLDLLYRNAIDVIICTSNEGMLNLKVLLNKGWPHLQNISLLVISERMERQAKELGFRRIILAKNPSKDAILDALDKGKIV